MTAALWIDAGNGAAGDMLLGAFVDAGVPVAAIEAPLQAIAELAGEVIGLHVEPVRRHGLRATLVTVRAQPSHVHRSLTDIAQLITAAGLPAAVEGFSLATFERLARAEAHVHGVDLAEVHFHEVGALDAIADVVGCASALHSLDLLGDRAIRVVSPVAVGSGQVSTAHGVLPVPVPAVLRLLSDAGAEVTAGTGEGESCTPTGAALLASLATAWGGPPAMRLQAGGSGAGTRDPLERPNLTRVVIGESLAVPSTWTEQAMVVVESTVDDLDPRVWPAAMAAIQAAGSSDVWLTPTLMRHGRPGHVLTALCTGPSLDAVRRAIVRSTSTLGVRVHEVDRFALPRDVVETEIDGQRIPVKRGLLDGEAVVLQPEYADAEAAANATGRPVAEVLDRARERARTPTE